MLACTRQRQTKQPLPGVQTKPKPQIKMFEKPFIYFPVLSLKSQNPTLEMSVNLWSVVQYSEWKSFNSLFVWPSLLKGVVGGIGLKLCNGKFLCNQGRSQDFSSWNTSFEGQVFGWRFEASAATVLGATGRDPADHLDIWFHFCSGVSSQFLILH